MTKLRKFTKGENFSRFCERFQEYVYITKIEDINLYVYFLQNVDDETYSTLKSVKLTGSQKGNAELFCNVYKNAIYGEVMDCKQQSGKNISDFVYRLCKKANIAYADSDIIDENCLLTFMRGIKMPT